MARHWILRCAQNDGGEVCLCEREVLIGAKQSRCLWGGLSSFSREPARTKPVLNTLAINYLPYWAFGYAKEIGSQVARERQKPINLDSLNTQLMHSLLKHPQQSKDQCAYKDLSFLVVDFHPFAFVTLLQHQRA